MSKCFITKLPSSVDNDSLPVLGQLKIKWLKQEALTDNSVRILNIATNDKITVRIYGAHFTDSTLASNDGNSRTITAADGNLELYVSNDADAVLTIDNKYSLTVLGFGSLGRLKNERSVYFDITDIRYCTNLTVLYLNRTHVNGDINAISKLTNLTSLYLSSTQVSGDIDNLAGLTKLTTMMELKYMSLTGDMSKIPANVNFISQMGRKINTNFTWTAKGRQNVTFLAMEGGIPFNTISMDNMLIDQATCTLKSNDSEPWNKVIAVSGTRTSASDAAVEAIQNMGVTITGVTKVS